MKSLCTALALLGSLLLGCAGSSAKASKAEDPCLVRARVDRDAVFKKECSPYLQPPGGLDVIDGATLTIEAGVEIRFSDGDWLEVGAAGKPGRLIAKGTPEAPIVLTTASPVTARTWLGVWFHSGTLPGSELSHAVVRRAGGHNTHSQPNLLMGCVTMTGVKPDALRVADVRVEGCEHGGFRITDSQPQLGPLQVVDTQDGFVLDAAAVGVLPASVVQRGVARNVITGGRVQTNALWRARPLPFLVTGDIEVGGASQPLLALQPGLTLELEGGRRLAIGATEPGGLLAVGTADQPVVLRARDPSQPWSGISFGEQTREGSRIEHAELRGTGVNPAVRICRQQAPALRSPVHLSHVRFAETGAEVEHDCR